MSMSNVYDGAINSTVQTVDDAWTYAFQVLYDMAKANKEQQPMDSRDGSVVAEVLNAVIQVKDPTRNIVKSPVRNMPLRYAVGEFLWYMSANPELTAIHNITKAWDRMSDDGVTVNSNYGWCISEKFDFNQWEYVKKLLKTDPNTRQAIIHIKEPRNTFKYPTKDLNCTCILQFILRDNKLYLTTYMRSNDVWMGMPYDMFSFTCFQILMAMELGVELGTYTHIAGSLHLYERDFNTSVETIEAALRKDNTT